MPYDGVAMTTIDTVAKPVTIFVHFMAVAGMVFAIVCGIFNFVFRKKR